MAKIKQNSLKKRLQAAIIHVFGGIMVDNITPTRNEELETPYLFNFRSAYTGSFNSTNQFTVTNGTMGVSIDGNSEVKKEDKETDPRYIPVKPIDVLNELETVPTPFSVECLDEKIAILKDKQELIESNPNAKREVKALIERLENRKKYAEHYKFFEQFQNTTEEKVQALLDNHKTLEMHPSDLFIPEFPDIAIKTMKEYTKIVKKITGKTPVFQVIAPKDQFKEIYKKRDPILLVQSPFGFYYQILGAWDSEMILLTEL